MSSTSPILGIPDATKRGRIIETAPTKKGGPFWYQLVVVEGPRPAGAILREASAPRAFTYEGALEPRPDPVARQRALERLQRWARINGWSVEGNVTGPRGSETITPDAQPLPTNRLTVDQVSHRTDAPKIAHIVEGPVTRLGACWYYLVVGSDIGVAGKVLAHAPAPQARDAHGVRRGSPDPMTRQAALADLTAWANVHGWLIQDVAPQEARTS
jgi:hypothetical protein